MIKFQFVFACDFSEVSILTYDLIHTPDKNKYMERDGESFWKLDIKERE